MHEPLPREIRKSDVPTGALGLVWACTLVVIVAVAGVAVASVGGELFLRGSAQVAALTRTSSANVPVVRFAASSTGDLFSNMPLP